MSGDVIGNALAAAMENETIEIWPENWQAFSLFAEMGTQWRQGFAGPTGLDYLVLHRELDDLGVTGADRQRMKADIRTMESAVLKARRAG